MKTISNLIILFLLMIMTAGCKVGPNYRVPVTPMPEAYSEDRPGETTAIADEDLFQWWKTFNDPFLDCLLEEAVGNSFDYRIALEQICQARAQYWTQFTQILPDIEGDFQATRFRTSQSFASVAAASATTPAISPIQNFFQTGFDAVWELDLFGALRRNADAAYDLWQASVFNAREVKIVVLSEVANTYNLICSFQTKISLSEQVVQIDEELLALSKDRFQAGLTNYQEVETILATLEADKGVVDGLVINLKQAIYSLGILLGRLPETLLCDFLVQREIPKAQGRVPAGLPGDLLRRRPDIRAAERQLASATEQIGVAMAALFPKIDLIGSSSSFASNPLQGANIGWSSDTFRELFKSPSRIWGVGTLITFPVFDFGKRCAGVQVEVALQRQAYLTYQKTVIGALQDAEQALAAYFNEEKREQSLTKETTANLGILELTINQFNAGLANFTQVLQAKEVWLASANALTDSQQALTTDLIAVYKSLGGDW